MIVRTEAEQLWEVRRKCSGAMFEMGDAKLNEDIVIPMSSYAKFIAFLMKLKKATKLAIPTFGHLADGNLHVNIMYHREDPAESKTAEETVALVMRTVVAMGGAISGEHGIGLAKTPFMRAAVDARTLELMAAVKRAFDPKGLLNPGKLLPDFD